MKRPLVLLGGLFFVGVLLVLLWSPRRRLENAAVQPVAAPVMPVTPVKSPSVASAASSAVAGPAGVPFAPATEGGPAVTLSRFRDWAGRHAKATAEERAAMLQLGGALALERRDIMMDLIKHHPKEALKQALPYGLRKTLPPEILALLEVPVSGRGDFTSYCAYQQRAGGGVFRKAEIDGRTYDAYVYGERMRQWSLRAVALWGVALDDQLALAESPLRILDAAEANDLAAAGKVMGDLTCPLCAKPSTAQNQQTLADFGGDILGFDTPAHASSYARVFAFGSSGSSGGGGPISSGDRQGTITFLYMRVVYPDDPVEPISEDAAYKDLDDLNKYYEAASFHTVSIVGVVTPPLMMPYPKKWYETPPPPDPTAATAAPPKLSDLTLHTLAAARAAGYNPSDYNQTAMRFATLQGIAWAGLSGSPIKLVANGLGVLGHELGHNLGLPHACYWDTSISDGSKVSANPIAAPGSPVETTSAIGHETTYGPGKSVEYGDAWSIMGAVSSGHFNAYEKSGFGWLPDAGVRLFNAAGGDTVRVHSLESDVLEEGKKYAIRVRRSSDREYWFQYRTTVAGNSFLTNGLQIIWSGNAETAGDTDLLDATPNSNPSYSANRADSALPLGRTFHDPVINLFVTVTNQNGTGTTAYLDVVVNIGLFPTNLPPSFASLGSDTNNISPGDTVILTATASDPNFDDLAYHWTFDDNGVARSAASVSHTFASAGEYVVRCVVSDMKGGTASKSMVIRVGNPATYRIGGFIRDAGFNPIPDVRVDNGVTGGGYRHSFTDTDGSYVIAGIPNGSYLVGAWKPGQHLEPFNTTLPISINNDHDLNVNWRATPSTTVWIESITNATEGGLTTVRLKRYGSMDKALPVVFKSPADTITVNTASGSDYTQTNGVTVTHTNSIPPPDAVTVDFKQVTFPIQVDTLDLTFPTLTGGGYEGPEVFYVDLAYEIQRYFNYYRIDPVVGFTNTLLDLKMPTWMQNVQPTYNLPPGNPNQNPDSLNFLSASTYVWAPPTYVIGRPKVDWPAVTIDDGDTPALPIVSVVGSSNRAMENGQDPAEFQFTLSQVLTNDLTVYYTLSGTAVNGQDYTYLPGSFVIPAGVRSFWLPVFAINDHFVEGTETVTLTITPTPATYQIGGAGFSTVNIGDDDLPSVTITTLDRTATESGATGSFNITRSGNLDLSLTVYYLVSGTASAGGAGQDFQTLSGSVTIPADQPTATVLVRPIQDSVNEGEETVVVTLTSSDLYNIGIPNTVSIAIQDDERNTVTVSSSGSVGEGGGGSFTLTRTGPTASALTVNYNVAGGAVPGIGADYNSIGNSAVISVGATSVNISVQTLNDSFYEGTETVVLTLLTDPIYNLGTPFQATLNITDNDPTSNPSVGFLAASTTNSEGVATVRIPVLLSAPPPRNSFTDLIYRTTQGNYTNGSPAVIKVNYNVTGGTATNGVDYSFVNGTLVWSNVVYTYGTGNTDDVTNDTSILGPDGLAQMIAFNVTDDGVLKFPTNRSFVITLSNWVENIFVGPTHQYLARSLVNGSDEDTNFLVGYGPNGPVNDLVVDPIDDSLYVGGSFTSVNATNAVRLAHILPSGLVDTNNFFFKGCNSSILAVARQSSGKLIIGGLFTNTIETIAPVTNFNYRRLARINADGSLDTTFTPIDIGGGTTTGAGRNVGQVNTITIDSSDNIYVGGSFTNVNSAGRTNFVRLTPNGAVDGTFTTSTGPDGQVRTIMIRTDGNVVIGGDFGTYAGATASRLALINSSGTLSANLNANGNVFEVVPASPAGYPTDSILVVGAFTTIVTSNANRIAVLNANGSYNNGFRTTGDKAGADGTISSVAVQSAGNIFIGGTFNNIGDGTPTATRVREARNFARLTSVGQYNSTFPASGPNDRRPNATVNVVRVDSTDQPYFGGNFLNDVFPYPNNYTFDIYRSHTYVISDNDLAAVSITATLPTAAEGGTNGAFRISSAASPPSPVAVNFSVTGTAARSADYVLRTNGVVLTTSTITIPAGTNQVVVTVEPIDDTVEEFSETVKVTLLSVPGGRIVASGPTTVSIADNDASLQFEFASTRVLESVGVVPITIRRSGSATNNTVTVDYLISDGTAVNGVDYFGTNGTLTLVAGQLTTNFSITVSNNIIVDGDRTVNLTLTNASGGVPLGGQNTSTVIIQDDDTAFQFAVGNFVTTELSTNGIVTIYRLGLSTNTDTVEFTATDGTATNGVDFVASTNLLTFPPGVTNLTFPVPVLTNADFTGDLQVSLTLTNPSAPTALGIINSNATLTIRDDECQLTFASNQYSVNEYAGAIGLTINRVGGTINTVAVDFSTLNGIPIFDALAGADYFTNFGTLTFQGDVIDAATDDSGLTVLVPGETSKSITVSLLDDQIGEYDETFTVNLSAATGGPVPGSTLLGADPTATVTIIDNEQPGDVLFEYAVGGGADTNVVALGRQNGGKVIIGGQFTTVNGISFNRLARLQTNGLPDGSFLIGAGASSDVTAVAVQSDDKIYIAGAFTTFNLTNRAGIARLNADGSLDLGFDPGTGANGVVRSLLVQTNGQVIIGGDFTTFNGTNATRLARLNANGSLDTSFTATADASVYTLALQADGKVVLAGAFNNVNGTGVNKLARLNADGTLDPGFVGTGADATIYSVALQADGKLVIGGAFTVADGVARNFMARLQTNGVIDSAFSFGAGPSASVNAVAIDTNGKILIGGDFTSYDGISRNFLARIKSNGQLDAFYEVGAGPNGSVRAVLAQANTTLVIGGDFTQVNGISRNRVALIHGDEATNLSAMEFASASYTTDEAAGSVEIIFTRYGATNSAASFTFYTTDGTGTNGIHYTAVSNSVAFALGARTQTWSVPITDDATPSNARTVNLFMTNAVGGILDTITNATLYIDDNDVQFTIAGTSRDPSATDLWDLSQGAIVTADSGIRTGSSAGNMFDGRPLDLSGDESPNTLFRDNQPAGSLHFVEWQTPAPVTVRSFNLIAAHDPLPLIPPYNRAFSQFNLYASNTVSGQFELIYSFTPPVPYGADPQGRFLYLADNVTQVLTASNFRAEFVQYASGSFAGPRIVELDGFATPMGGVTVNERDGTADIGILRTGSTNVPASVFFSTVDGIASSPVDFIGQADTLVSFAVGQVLSYVTLTLVNDNDIEPVETAGLRLTDTGTNVLSVVPSPDTTLTIIDDESTVQFGATTASAVESMGSVTLNVTRGDYTGGTVTVLYSTVDQSAVAGLDYVGVTNATLTFGPGVASLPITITLLNNKLAEADETFQVVLGGPGGGGILGTDAAAQVTVLDDDSAFTIDNQSVVENTGPVTLTVTRSFLSAEAPNRTVTVNFATASGTAISGTHFTGASGLLTFGPGVLTQPVTVSILNNQVTNASRTFKVNLSGAAGEAALGSPSSGTVTITDNDSALQFSAGATSVLESAGSLTLTVTRTGVTDSAVTVPFTFADGTATNGADYFGTNDTLTFGPGVTSQPVVVGLANNALAQSNRVFTVTLGAPIGEASLVGNTAVDVTILDDDSVLQFASTNLSVSETAGYFPARVTRTGYTSNSVSVTMTSADLTAVNGVDYTAVNSLLTFAAGETSKTVNVPIINDLIIEGSLTFRLSLSNAGVEAELGAKSNLVVSILDDDFRLIAPAGTNLTAESLLPANGAIDPFETVTVGFALKNMGNVPTTNLVATLLSTNGVSNPGAAQTYGELLANSANVVTQYFSFTVVTNDHLQPTFQLQDGALNLGTVTFDLPLGHPFGFTNKALINIPNTLTLPSTGKGSVYPSVITVSNLVGAVHTVTLRLDRLRHYWPDDIDILLVSPDGRKSYVMSDAGGDNTINEVTLVFDDNATDSLPNSGPIVSGAYKPANFEVPDTFAAPAPSAPYATNFGTFRGSTPNGDWSLYVMDDLGGSDSQGVLAGGWSLTLTTVIPAVDLELAVSDMPDPVVLGNDLTYTLTVTNHGPATASGVVLTNILPGALTIVSTNSSQGIVQRAGNVVRFDLGSLAGGSAANCTITVTPLVGGYLTNVAQVWMPGAERYLTNNFATNDTTVTGGATLSAALPGPGGPILGGFSLTLDGMVSMSYVIEASTDLVHWTPIFTNWANGSSSILFTDTNAPGFGQRFYRTVEKP